MSEGDAITGQEGINYAPGVSPPWTVALGAEYNWRLASHDVFARVDWEYESRNPWLSAQQDPRNDATYNYGFTYTLPAKSCMSLRSAISVGEWQISAFVDNVLNKHTVINYALGQPDGHNPVFPPTPQQNAYTYRPRTMGITATWRTH